MPQINKDKIELPTCKLVALGNTRILTLYAQKSAWTLYQCTKPSEVQARGLHICNNTTMLLRATSHMSQ